MEFSSASKQTKTNEQKDDYQHRDKCPFYVFLFFLLSRHFALRDDAKRVWSDLHRAFVTFKLRVSNAIESTSLIVSMINAGYVIKLLGSSS